MFEIEKKPHITISIFHFDNIGKLYVYLDFFEFEDLLEQYKQNKIRIFNKCEDGVLDLKIKFYELNFENSDSHKTENVKAEEINVININIFINASMSPKLNATKFILKPDCKRDGRIFDRLSIVYFINSNLFNKNIFFENSLECLRVRNCFKSCCELNIDGSQNLKNSILSANILSNDDIYLDKIKEIKCLACKNVLLDFSDFKKVNQDYEKNSNIKIVENFDFDYAEKLENLSCHENHTEDIIPNMEEKLKNV